MRELNELLFLVDAETDQACFEKIMMHENKGIHAVCVQVDAGRWEVYEQRNLSVELTDLQKQMAIRAGEATYTDSRKRRDNHGRKGKSLDEEIQSIGAEIGLVQMLLDFPLTLDTHKRILSEWDPIQNVRTFGSIPDIPIGRGIEVRNADSITKRLIVRKSDAPKRIYVFVPGVFPKYGFGGFVLRSWISLRIYRSTLSSDREEVLAVPLHGRNLSFSSFVKAISSED